MGFLKLQFAFALPASCGELELTAPSLRHTIAFVPTTFSRAFTRVRWLVADFRANVKFQDLYLNRYDDLDCQIDTLVYDLYAPPPTKSKPWKERQNEK